MNIVNLSRRLAADSRDFCIACIVLPCIAFGLGVLAISFPIPILSAVIAGACLGWVGVYRAISRRCQKDLDGRITSVITLAVLSLSTAFGAGMIAAGPGGYDVMAMAISFGCGVIGTLLFRNHQREYQLQKTASASRRAGPSAAG